MTNVKHDFMKNSIRVAYTTIILNPLFYTIFHLLEALFMEYPNSLDFLKAR